MALPSTAFGGGTTPIFKLNWIWLQNYSPDDPPGFTSSMKFDHVVAAKKSHRLPGVGRSVSTDRAKNRQGLGTRTASSLCGAEVRP